MKTIYLIGGTMGVGKTTISQQLKKELENSIFLDGDWCWDADPFQVTDETKDMVLDNICYVLNNFIKCSAYKNIIFCWVMHQQEIINHITQKLNTTNCKVKTISLLVDENSLKNRITKDINNGIRQSDVLQRSIERIHMYDCLDTIKIDTSNKTIQEIIEEIKREVI